MTITCHFLVLTQSKEDPSGGDINAKSHRKHSKSSGFRMATALTLPLGSRWTPITAPHPQYLTLQDMTVFMDLDYNT